MLLSLLNTHFCVGKLALEFSKELATVSSVREGWLAVAASAVDYSRSVRVLEHFNVCL
jgi:hypothetical protein